MRLKIFYFSFIGYDPRRFNAPTASEIAVILPGDGTEVLQKRDIQVYVKSGGVKRITEFNAAYDPLHYVVMFPHGDLGYHFNIAHYNLANDRKNIKHEWSA